MGKDKYYKLGITFIVLAVVFTIMGGTLAYWNWQSSTAQKTEVTFTVGSNFSCGANGGGNLTSNAYFAPTTCDNSTYALKRTITTSITNNGTDPVYMDLWLNVVSMGEGLRNSDNFKYALTTSESSCTTGVEASGTFKGKANGSKVELLSGVTSGSTYYLYIWLDAAEESQSTMNQSVNLTLGGSCTNEVSSEQTVYTVNLYDENVQGYNEVWIGQSIPSGITTYNTPDAAITALEAAYSNANSGAIPSLPVFLKHIVESNIVTESYVGFVITPTIATNYPGMVTGTYYLSGGTNGDLYNDNKIILQNAFGSTYCTDYSFDFYCGVSGFGADARSNGIVGAYIYGDTNLLCGVDYFAGGGDSSCWLDDGE